MILVYWKSHSTASRERADCSFDTLSLPSAVWPQRHTSRGSYPNKAALSSTLLFLALVLRQANAAANHCYSGSLHFVSLLPFYFCLLL